MTDIIMIAILAVCIGLTLLLTDWCAKQTDRTE